MKKVVFYGAGIAAEREMKKADLSGYEAVCFCDADPNKHGTTRCGLPVMGLAEAGQRFGDFDVFVTVIDVSKHRVNEYLINNGISKERIINFEEWHMGCDHLETVASLGTNILSHCCGSPLAGMSEIPMVRWNDGDSCDEVVDRFLQQRHEIMEALRKGEASPCGNCTYIQKLAVPHNRKLTHIGFGFPAICNCACIYCPCNSLDYRKRMAQDSFADRFDFAGFMKRLSEKGVVTDETVIQLAFGEATINPWKDKILDAVEQYVPCLFTSAIVFDERIAQWCARRGGGGNVSVDAGTRQTYRAVKGVDAFDKVWANIAKYVEVGANVEVKYIFVEQNDNDNDVKGFVNKAKEVGVRACIISSDINKKQDISDDTIERMQKMYQRASEAGINVTLSLSCLKPMELERIAAYGLRG